MKKGDISEMIQRLKAGREETPNVASITNAPARKMKSEVESIHKAKEMEFPLEFADEKAPKMKAPSVAVKKAVKMVEPKKAEPVAKKAEPKMKAKMSEPPAKGKGSEEMKAKMAAIRAKKGKKE
jgi:hypothetical protein